MTPATDYYALASGRWEGTFSLAITDWRGFWNAQLTRADRVGFVALWLTERLLGKPSLTTHVQLTDDPGTVLHTAELRRFGRLIYVGQRMMRIAADGVSLSVSGRESTWPRLTRERVLPMGGAVARSARRMHYVMAMAGELWEIDFAIGEVEAHSVLTCAWGRAAEDLRRDA